MKITIEKTSKIVELETETGVVPARIWEGHTDSGIPVICYITRIAVANTEGVDHSQFHRELSEQRAPSAEVIAIPSQILKHLFSSATQ